MYTREHLVTQHIREYECRQRHADELLERAKKHAEGNPDLQKDLTVFQSKRDEIATHAKQLKHGQVDQHAVQAIEEAGPMGIWYGLISELESFIEGIKH